MHSPALRKATSSPVVASVGMAFAKTPTDEIACGRSHAREQTLPAKTGQYSSKTQRRKDEDRAQGPAAADRRAPWRRRALKTAAAAVGTAALSAPFIRNAAAAETTTWKVQTSWPAGVGLQTFKAWCGTIKEKTGGELEFKPFAAKEVVGDFELLDGVKNGVLEAMNSFTLYWAGKLPATAFLSSYLMGLRYPHEWDIFFYSKDGLKVAREIFAKQGLYYVNRIHHGPNIIHSKKPIRTIEDFKDLKLRVPGGMIAEGFAAAGAKTTLLPGGEVFSALEKGTIEAADYTGPAVNWDLGFQQVSKFIWTGPPGLESIYQPVDLMDFVVRMDVWNKLSPKMKQWVDDEVQVYSNDPPCRDPEGGPRSMGQVREGRHADQPHAGRRPAEVAAHRRADLVQMGEQGQGRGAAVQDAARGHGVAHRRLRHAGHVQGAQDRGLSG